MKFIDLLCDVQIKPEIAYIVLALFFGVLFILIVPPFCVQDESSHFYRAYQLSDLHILSEKRRSNLYLMTAASPITEKTPPIKWTELNAILVKDKKNNVYIYGAYNAKWKFTKLNNAVFKGIHFPASGAAPVFLREQDKRNEIYNEIAEKKSLYPIALYQTGDFLPSSIVENIKDILHHLPYKPYEKENKFSFSRIISFFHHDLHPEVKSFIDFNNTALYAPFSYLPQICGIWVGKLLQLPPVMLLYLARLFTFLCSMTLVYYAIKIMPILKWSTFLLAMMPLTFWETASASYDNLTISLTFLLIAVFFYYALIKAKIKVFDIGVIFILTLLVSLSKMAYLPIIFLYFLIPKEKIGMLSKYLVIFFLLLFVNISFVGMWSIFVHKIYVPYFYDGNIDPYAQLLYVWKHPLRFFNTMWQYCSNFGWSYFSQYVGMVGFLDVPQITLLKIYFAMLLVVSFFGDKQDVQLKTKQKLLISGVFLANFFVVFLLIYLSCTEVGAPIINGMRQRYLIPFSILFFLVLQSGLVVNNIEYYKSRFLPILVFVTLSITLFATFCEYYL